MSSCTIVASGLGVVFQQPASEHTGGFLLGWTAAGATDISGQRAVLPGVADSKKEERVIVSGRTSELL